MPKNCRAWSYTFCMVRFFSAAAATTNAIVAAAAAAAAAVGRGDSVCLKTVLRARWYNFDSAD